MILSLSMPLTKMRIKTPSLQDGVRISVHMESSKHGAWHFTGAHGDGDNIEIMAILL